MTIALVLAIATSLVLTTGPASAKVIHKQLFSFESGAAEGDTFAELQSLAIDNTAAGASKEDVYASFGGGRVVDKYGPEGKYLCQITGAGSKTASKKECAPTGAAAPGEEVGFDFGVAVTGSGNVLVPNLIRGTVNEFSGEGSWLAEITTGFPDPNFVAGASNGDVYISTRENKLVRYEPTAAKAAQFASGTALQPPIEGLAVDTAASSPALGDVYVADGGTNEVYVFGESEALRATIEGPPGEKFSAVSGVAVDPSNGDVYVADKGAHVVDEFGPEGKGFISQVPMPGGKATPAAMAINAANGDLYVGDKANNVVDVFAPSVTVPDVSVSAPTGLGQTSIEFHGEVDPAGGGAVTSCVFEYGIGSVSEHTAPCAPAVPYSSTTTVSASLSGLSKSSAYQYRLKAENASGASETEIGHFTTTGPPQVTSEWAIAGPSTATLNAELSMYEYAATCSVQLVSEAEYSASAWTHATTVPCAPEDLGSGYATVKVIAKVAGLEQQTVYEYRFVGESKAGATDGAVKSFATFGMELLSNELLATAAGGEYTQAGGHPFEMVTHVVFNATPLENGALTSSGTVKDVKVQLPTGFVGNPSATELCSRYDAERFQCSPSSEVGIMEVEQANTKNGKTEKAKVEVGPLFNIVPPKGVAAEFGARFNDFVNGYIQARVRTGEGYGVEADSLNISSLVAIRSVTVRMWGVPGSSAHDGERECPRSGPEPSLGYEAPPCASALSAKPLLTLPTSCSEMSTTVFADSYQAPGQYVAKATPAGAMGSTTGCESLHFTPSMSVTPTSTSADSPTGVTVHLHVPQNENPTGLAEADMKDAVVTLPQGITVNPAEASGLTGCSEAQVGYLPAQSTPEDLRFTPEPARCPDSSKIGKVTLETPLFPHRQFTGGIYIAQQGNAGAAQGSNPFGSLLAIYLAIDEPETGVVIKLAGHVVADPKTGQLTTTFDNNPQLPFENLDLTFFSGQRSALATPTTCGSYQTSAALSSWAAPGTNVSPYIEPFSISSAAGGGACAAPGFAPGFSAGTSNNQAGGDSAFVMNLARKDGEQRLSTVDMTMPKGLEGMISKVTPCPEAQANAGTCPASSKIGHVVVEAGVGNQPITLPEAGKPEDPVYLTEKYGGAPFGLSIVVPAEAGPFNLGTVIVRARIEVNPTTAQVSVLSNPMPTELQGIPLDVKAIHVDINRPGFMFNPTSCEPTAVKGALGSAEGLYAGVSSRFQAAGCRGLAFKPHFRALIHAHHSKKNGEYLHVAITSAFGQANIHEVHVKLPGKLPSRLSTLKLACTEQQFAANPAGCPPGSFVGTAVAHTPVLPVPLAGPAVFVSHAGRGFPNLDLVLQGDGVHITLVGDTYINKRSITTSTFKTVPDVPVTRFDLVLPAGPHSALAGDGNMCAHALHMPTTITGQNGKVLKHDTKVQVTGCRPEITVRKHKVHGGRARIVLQVPSAGKLVANGKGIGRVVKRVRKHGGRVAITVRLKRHVRRMLARRHHRRLRVTVHLRFKAHHGRRIESHLRLLMR